MIKTALVAMTIVGCDCDARLCEYVGETPARWASVADCEAAMKSQILHRGNFDYPLISGICRTVSTPSPQLAATGSPPQSPLVAQAAPPAAALPTELSHRPSVAVGSLATATEAAAARPVAYEAMVDGGRGVLYRTRNGYAVVKTGLGRAASETIGLAKQSAGWLAAKLPGGL